MSCDAIREALSTSNENSEVVQSHLARCPECSAFARSNAALSELLATDVEQPLPLGFDTRFHARLRQERKPWFARVWVWAPAIAAASVVCIITLVPSAPQTEAADLQLAADLELVENLNLLSEFEEVEALEVLAHLDLSELEAMEEL